MTHRRKSLLLVVVFVCFILALSQAGCVQPKSSSITPADEPAPPRIAFVSRGEDTTGLYTDIYVMDADGSNRINLTNDPAEDRDPSWSPDGKRIAFTSRRDGDLYHEIYVMEANGSNQTRLTHNPGSDTLPKWSPDGGRIAFQNEGTLHVMDADGTHQTSLSHPVSSHRWSPDGKQIAFEARGLGIAVLDVDTGSLLSTSNHGSDRGPSWSPDGRRIAFTSNRDGDCEIYIMDADGGNLTSFRDQAEASKDSEICGCSPSRGLGPFWSPDGKKIAFGAEAPSGHDVCVIDADGSNRINLTNNLPGLLVACLSWSPDSQKIAFDGVVWMREPPGIYVMGVDGSNLTRLTPSGNGDVQPSWSPR